MNKTTEVLTLAKEILESEVEWCQGRLYVWETDENGFPTNSHNPKILSACAAGAVELALFRLMPSFNDNTYADRREIGLDAEKRLMEHIEHQSVPSFNDDSHTTKEDVLLVFKKAIESE